MAQEALEDTVKVTKIPGSRVFLNYMNGTVIILRGDCEGGVMVPRRLGKVPDLQEFLFCSWTQGGVREEEYP